MMKRKNKQGFTLVEILLAILIFSIVIVAAFQSLSALSIGKIQLIQETNMRKEAFFFTERLFDLIKK